MEKRKTVVLLLTSIGLANIGEWIYFIALNLMILNQGGSALSVGVLYIIRPMADVLTNLVASKHIDKLPKKKWMILLTVVRSLLIEALVMNQHLLYIYVMVFLIQISISLYEPLNISFTTLAIAKNERKKFNSWNSLVSSGGFLIGPAVAGLLLSIGTPMTAVLINSVALLGSALLFYFLPNYSITQTAYDTISFVDESREGLNYLKGYYKTNRMIIVFYMLISSLFVLAAGLDSVEASFSKRFDTK